MSAPMVHSMRYVIGNVFTCYNRICHRVLNSHYMAFRPRTRPRLINSSLALVTVLCHENVKSKLKPPDPATLTEASLIRNASSVAVDATSTVLSQVVASIIQTEREFKQAVEALAELLEFQLEITGKGSVQEEKLWEDILEARHRLTTVRHRQQELSILYSSVEKLMEASGEVAFFAGAEYAVTCTGERVHSANTYINQVKAESRQAEDALHQLEVKVIEVTARKAKEEEERLKAEATRDVTESVKSDNGSPDMSSS